MNNELKTAGDFLKRGGIVIFPTDTAFGIGCRIDNEESVERLFKIRKRPNNMAVPVLVNSIKMTKAYLKEVDEKVLNLMKKYWPGALTVVYNCKIDKVNPLIRGNGETLGVRMPDHKELLELIAYVGVPILGPSANFHDENTPYSAGDLNPELVGLVDFLLPGKTDGSGVASTVIDCTKDPWKILRQGAVKIEN